MMRKVSFYKLISSKKCLPENPFAVLDQEGVGKLVETGVKLGRSVKPQLKTGICGEHGGEKSSIEFCYRAGLDYVSCSPFTGTVSSIGSSTIHHPI